MSQHHAPFIYNPLNPGEIRVLYFLPDAGEAGWSMKTIQLHDHESKMETDFDALSYTWGDQSHTFPLLCNGQELRIHQNLKNALPYLAQRQSTRPIWIDAVCINQSDSEEKFTQIRMMHRIYRHATQVWVWLGRGLEHSAEAIALLPTIATAAGELAEIPNIHELPEMISTESLGLPEQSSPIWQTINDIINNSWLGRLWIVQEVALAKSVRVLYGRMEIDWEILGHAIEKQKRLKYLLKKSNIPGVSSWNEYKHYVFLIREAVQDTESTLTWQERLQDIVLYTTTGHNCFDPRDRVFGIWGLANEEQLNEIGLQNDMSLVDIYTKFTHFLLRNTSPRNTGWWGLFNMITITKRRPGLPSWCPDYHNFAKREDGFIPGKLEQKHASKYPGAPYAASRGTSIALQTMNTREFTVRGKIFDKIDRIFPAAPSVDDNPPATRNSGRVAVEYLYNFGLWEREIASAVLGLTPVMNESDKLEINNTLSLEDYWRTLVAGVTELKDKKITYELFCEYRLMVNGLIAFIQKFKFNFQDESDRLLDLPTSDPKFNDEDREMMNRIGRGTPGNNFMGDVISCLRNRRLFTTSRGRFGFGPDASYGSPGIEDGDILCILNLASTAHVLRSVKNAGREVYQIIGQAYVHGMMHGEIEMLDIQEQDIVLV